MYGWMLSGESCPSSPRHVIEWMSKKSPLRLAWMMVASGALAVMMSSVFPRYGYSATTASRCIGKVTNYG